MRRRSTPQARLWRSWEELECGENFALQRG